MTRGANRSTRTFEALQSGFMPKTRVPFAVNDILTSVRDMNVLLEEILHQLQWLTQDQHRRNIADEERERRAAGGGKADDGRAQPVRGDGIPLGRT